MNGKMMNYKKYQESLEHTPEPEDIINPVAIDYKGLVNYAKSKGVEPFELSESEKNSFIITRKAAVG